MDPHNDQLYAGTRFSKVPKLFGRISGDIIPFVSSKRRHLEAQNFTVILIVHPFTTYDTAGVAEQAGRSFTNGFSGPKSSRETGRWTESSTDRALHQYRRGPGTSTL